MSDTYKISFKDLRLRPEMTQMFEALERGFSMFKIDYYIVGAVARDAWMTGIHHIEPRSITRDVDFGVFVNDHGTYEALKTYLIDHEGFRPSKGNAFILFFKNNDQVDLLPFGGIEEADGKVHTEGLGLTSINLQGFKEVYESDLPSIDLEGKHIFRFCSLPGYVILKMISWDDRPDERQDDIKDIASLLLSFYDMYEEIIWEKHNDLYGDHLLPHDQLAAIVMGREMREIALRNPRLFDRLSSILDRETRNPDTSKMAELMLLATEETIAEKIDLLNHIMSGFHE